MVPEGPSSTGEYWLAVVAVAALGLGGFVKAFIAAWTASRLVDAWLTWAIIRMGLGYERNPVAAWFIGRLGLEAGLAAFTLLGVAMGFAIAFVVPRLLSCERCRTRFDEALFRALGVEGVAKVILAVALGVGLAPVLLNGFCLIASLYVAR